MSLGWGTLFNLGVMAYSAYQMKDQVDTAKEQTASMTEVNNEVNGGKENEIAASLHENSLSKPGENYMKLAGNLPPPKTKTEDSGLGFSSV